MEFIEGERVRISWKYSWAKNALGTISLPPGFAQDLVKSEAPWIGLTRIVKGRCGPIVFYWVWFDEPQRDADCDGPYRGAEIEADMLNKLEPSV